MRSTRILAACVVASMAIAAPALAGPPPNGGIFFADFNDDGKDDIARQGADIRVDLLDGTMSMGTGSFPTGGGSLEIVAVGNIDNNGNADIAAQGGGTIRLSKTNAAGTGPEPGQDIFISDGNGDFQVAALCDTNGDGIDEVVAVGTGASTGIVRLTDISGGAPGVNSFLSTAGGIWDFLYCMDANGDGDQDLYFNGTGAAAGTSRLNVSGTSTAIFYAQGGGVWDPTVSGDFNADGIDDLADTGNGAANGFIRVRLLDNTGNPTGPAGFIPNGGGALQLMTSADHNDDGRFDLAFQGASSNKVSLIAADGITEESSFFPPNAGGTAMIAIAEDTVGMGNASLISIFANEDIFIQTIDSSAVNGTGVLANSGYVLFVPN